MDEEIREFIKSKCTGDNYSKLAILENPAVFSFLAECALLCQPESIFVRTDSFTDADYIRKMAIQRGEESSLGVRGHTVHFDGVRDQARDKKATRYLLTRGMNLGSGINAAARSSGLSEIKDILRGSMRHKEMIVCFFCLGPLNSRFSIPCMQITDSFYVAHSEGILYRSAYKLFTKLLPSDEFFKFVHSTGKSSHGISQDVDKRRIYIDLKENTAFSANTQYAGNSLGLKKLALRLAIQQASRQGWLAEHMFVMGIKGKGPAGISYFCGAYPSACGKTSTAMLQGETIIGDDIAYLRKVAGEVRAVNVECGIFGIIKDVKPLSDPLIWEVITTPGEVIFSNLLVGEDGLPYWLGDGRQHPGRGHNVFGEWYRGKIDESSNEIPYAHKNARYAVSLQRLANCDAHLNDPAGVSVGAIVYGGRDSDTWPPVQESFNWVHGVITMGSSLESETTAATLGKEGVRTFNLMSNLDFLSIPIEKYIVNYIDFARGLKKAPLIFSVNYFLRSDNGAYLCSIEDKHIWFKWMQLRVCDKTDALITPMGLIPLYSDLKKLFKQHLHKDYTSDDYVQQFTLRIKENLAKIDRVVNIYKQNVPNAPKILFTILDEQRKRLNAFEDKYGSYISPLKLKTSVNNH